MDFDFQEQRRRFQQNLINFLNAHLDLGFTFCRSAQLEMEMAKREEGEYAIYKENAQTALETVRKFEGRIADAELWVKIHARADELEKLIQEL